MQKKLPTHYQPGQMFIIAIIFIFAISIMAISTFARIDHLIKFRDQGIVQEKAVLLAEAGIDYAIWQLNKQVSPAIIEGEGVIILPVGGQFEITEVDESTPDKRSITSVGYYPDATNPQATRTVKIDLSEITTTIAIESAAYAGDDGLTLGEFSSSSGFKTRITGNLFSNGPVTAYNLLPFWDWKITGNLSANENLPPNTCIPEHVTELCLEDQGPSPMYTPPITETDLKQNIEDNGNTIEGDYIKNCGIIPLPHEFTLGPTKVNGDVFFVGCTINLTGPLWVTGDFKMLGAPTIKLDDSLTQDGTIIIVDGDVELWGDTDVQKKINPDRYILIWATKQDTTDIVVEYKNVIGGGLVYAPEGLATFVTSSGNLISVAAKKLEIGGGTDLTFETGVTTATYDIGIGWEVTRGTYKLSK